VFLICFLKSRHRVEDNKSVSHCDVKLSPYSDGLGAGRPGFGYRQGKTIFLYSTASKSALGTTQPPIQCVPRVLSLRIKRQQREADHTPPSNTEVKNGGAIPQLPHNLHNIVLNNFTLWTTIIFVVLYPKYQLQECAIAQLDGPRPSPHDD
jgi:hypothetical protein